MSNNNDQKIVYFPDSPIKRARPNLTGDGGPPDDSIMGLTERLSALEGKIAGATWGIGLAAVFLAASLGVAATFVILHLQDNKASLESTIERVDARLEGRMNQLDGRIDSIDGKLDSLPDRLTDIANAISNSISATRQQPIIIMPPAPNEPNGANDEPTRQQ